MGDLANESILKIWNNENFKNLRKNMMTGEKSPECNDCYQLEKINTSSFRQIANKDFEELSGLVQRTSVEGYLDLTEVAYIDVRFSNKCNFKCRTCNPTQSSLIAQEYSGLFPPIDYRTINPPNALNNIIKMIPHLKRLNFAGGEPLLHDDHYLLLEELIKQKKTNIEMCYHTNLSNFSYKNWNILKLWNFFEKVFVVASIDDVGARGEFIRKGLDWKQFVKNAKLLKIFSPRVGFRLNITINVFNVLYLEEIIETLLQEGLVNSKDEIFFNLLTEPVGLNVQFLKNKIQKIAFPEIQKFIENGDVSFEEGKKEFLKLNNVLDDVRGENWRALFPKLSAIID